MLKILFYPQKTLRVWGLLRALIFVICVSHAPMYSCFDIESNELPKVGIIVPAQQIHFPAMSYENKLITELWRIAKRANPWAASIAVSIGVFILLYTSNEEFKKKVDKICSYNTCNHVAVNGYHDNLTLYRVPRCKYCDCILN